MVIFSREIIKYILSKCSVTYIYIIIEKGWKTFSSWKFQKSMHYTGSGLVVGLLQFGYCLEIFNFLFLQTCPKSLTPTFHNTAGLVYNILLGRRCPHHHMP